MLRIEAVSGEQSVRKHACVGDCDAKMRDAPTPGSVELKVGGTGSAAADLVRKLPSTCWARI